MLTIATFSPAADQPGGCYTCRYFGRRIGGSAVWCANPGGEHVRSQAERGCAFWERESGADDDLHDRPAAVGSSSIYCSAMPFYQRQQ